MINHHYCVHSGCSMHPTLREADLLEIVPYAGQTAQVGDVILFPSPVDDQLIVHRVISVTPQGIRTRGDNNRELDPYLLHPADIVGQVAAAWNGQKQRKIVGGRAGRVAAHIIYCLSAFKRRFIFLLRPLYHRLARQGFVHRLLPDRFKPRVVIFQTENRRLIRLLLGGRVIGRYDLQQCQWFIQRPFRLCVDEQMLSKNFRFEI